MPLIDNGIEYQSKDKSKGYDLIDGHTDTGIFFKPTLRGKKSTPQPNYFTVIHGLWELTYAINLQKNQNFEIISIKLSIQFLEKSKFGDVHGLDSLRTSVNSVTTLVRHVL